MRRRSATDARYVMVILAAGDTPADDEAGIRWARDYYDAVHPYAGTEGGYINMLSEDEGRVPQNYGRNYDRLRQVKATYDPDNLFHLNQNIAPAH